METKKNMSKVYTLGVDIGSTSSKCVIMSDGKTIESSAIIAKGAGTDTLFVKEWRTKDLGGNLGTKEYGEKVIENLEKK